MMKDTKNDNDMNTLYGRMMYYMECFYLHYPNSGVGDVIAELKTKIKETREKILYLEDGEESNPSPVSETVDLQYFKYTVAGGYETQISEMKRARKILIHHFPNLFIKKETK